MCPNELRPNEMCLNLKHVFSILRDANLKLNPRKCDFLKDKIKYLGFILSSKGVDVYKERVKVIR